MKKSNISTNVNKKIRILFIARTFPPLVGGMEKFAEDFYHQLGQLSDITLIANRVGKKHLLYFCFKVLFHLTRKENKYHIIHFNDAILSPLLPIIRLVSKAKVTFTVHGLDIVYNKFGYQSLVVPFLRKADRIFPVSHYTKQQCQLRKIQPEKLYVIPNGLNFEETRECHESNRQSLQEKIKIITQGKIILLSLGRLIRRKGHVWFLQNVFKKLPEIYVYLIAGDGPEFRTIENTVASLSLEGRVCLLGYVEEEEKECLFQLADFFIMPNISDRHDQEGFGIVLLEAAIQGLPSIATNIEGIPDAVINGVTGILIDENDTQGFIYAMENADFDKEVIITALKNVFDWNTIAQIYLREFIGLLDH